MKTSLALAIVLLLGCAATPSDTVVSSEGLEQDYYQLNERRFDHFVVKDRQVFAQYEKMILFPIQLHGMLIMPSADDEINRSWRGVTYEDMLPYVSSFDELANHLFSEGKNFELTDTGGDNVLAVEFRLKRYRPEVNRAGSLSAGTAGEMSVTSYGVMHMQAVVAHSQTGELIAVIEDAVQISPRRFGVTSFGNTTVVDPSSTISKANQRAAWRSAFRTWLIRFRSDLQDLRQAALRSADQEA